MLLLPDKKHKEHKKYVTTIHIQALLRSLATILDHGNCRHCQRLARNPLANRGRIQLKRDTAEISWQQSLAVPR
jgi:hypothetical protein